MIILALDLVSCFDDGFLFVYFALIALLVAVINDDGRDSLDYGAPLPLPNATFAPPSPDVATAPVKGRWRDFVAELILLAASIVIGIWKY